MSLHSQRHLRRAINARLRNIGWNSRKHYKAEFVFGTLSGKQYTSNNLPGDLFWDGRSGFGADFPVMEGDELNFMIFWKEHMYYTAEFDAHGGDPLQSEPTLHIGKRPDGSWLVTVEGEW